MFNLPSVYRILGSIFALGSAFMWALAAILFRRLGDKLSPLGMNPGKGIIALIGKSLMQSFLCLELI
jgi:drug/metabolite transporter (DMT)-like permease